MIGSRLKMFGNEFKCPRCGFPVVKSNRSLGLNSRGTMSCYAGFGSNMGGFDPKKTGYPTDHICYWRVEGPIEEEGDDVYLRVEKVSSLEGSTQVKGSGPVILPDGRSGLFLTPGTVAALITSAEKLSAESRSDKLRLQNLRAMFRLPAGLDGYHVLDYEEGDGV